jgi:hypothetical protein
MFEHICAWLPVAHPHAPNVPAGCRVADRCALKVDLCTDKTNPVDCASISTCQFVPSPAGGKCVTVPTANPCAALGAAGCALNPACQAVQRYAKP